MVFCGHRPEADREKVSSLWLLRRAQERDLPYSRPYARILWECTLRTGICAVYILTNTPGGVLYTGVTSDLRGRLWQHRHGAPPSSFASRYGCRRLVHFETTSDIQAAIAREKQIKSWPRSYKVRLIERENPTWKDLSEEWV